MFREKNKRLLDEKIGCNLLFVSPEERFYF